MKLPSISLFLISSFKNIAKLEAALTIAAADSVSGEIGAIGTSCIDTSLFDVAYHSSTGNGLCLTVGAVVPDLLTDANIYATIDARLLLGTDPSVILGLITDPFLDVAIEIVPAFPLSITYDAVDLRQYACVDLQLRADAYSGSQITDYYINTGFDLATYSYVEADLQGSVTGLLGDTTVYSAQGDLVSLNTVDTLSTTFETVSACDLAERLYLSLEAIYANPTLGDVRCLDSNGSAGSTIFLHVEDSSGAPVIHIETASPDTTVDPWLEFQTDYLAWRASNACPTPVTDASGSLTIVAADSVSGEIGAVGTACTTDSLYDQVYQSSPGNGVCLTAGAQIPDLLSSSGIYAQIDLLLADGVSTPQDIIDVITAISLDTDITTLFDGTSTTSYNSVHLRQYACVDLQLRAAGYTGIDILDYYTKLGYDVSAGYPYAYIATDVQGLVGGDIVYSAQGDIASTTSVDTLSTTFSTVSACDLAERLFLSIRAIYEDAATIGDVRCFDSNGSSGSTIFIHVEDSSGAPVIHIETTSPDPTVDPWLEFETEYLSWRGTNSCPPTPVTDASGSLTIAAVDSVSGEIGAAGTACSTDSLFDQVYQSSPGDGVCLTVGAQIPDLLLSSDVYTQIDLLLSTGADPQDIIDAITAIGFDTITNTVFDGTSTTVYNSVDLRQYACVDLQLRAAGYTGIDILDYYTKLGYDVGAGWLYPYVAVDIQGLAGTDIVYSAQGDIVSATTVDTLAGTFSLVSACDLAERLYLSLEAVYSDPSLGDVRCLDSNGSSGSTIFIHVEDSSGATVIHIETTDSTADPWPQFQTEYLTWRGTNGCPSSSPSLSPSLSSAPSTSLSPTTATKSPTSSPSASPTSNPTNLPTSASPTAGPTQNPTTLAPTPLPTNSPTLSPTTLAPTAVPTLPPTSLPTSQPTTASPTSKPISAAPTIPVKIYYPDWQNSNTCQSDGRQPSWMYVSDPWYNKYFTTSQQECCDTWYFWDLKCVPPAVNDYSDPVTQNPWYPDWQSTNTCQSDGKQPNWMYMSSDNIYEGYYFFRTQKECCDAFYWWDLKCMLTQASVSVGKVPAPSPTPPSSDLWYPDYAYTQTCVSDGKQPSWMGDGYLKESQEACCNTFYWWDATC